jgi:hypothetical protein
MELKEGTGPITTMCSCGSFLEIYKENKTFRVRTPESIDPEETNPNAPWVASPVADVGSSNLSIARVLLQSRQMLDSAMFDGKLDKDAVILQLHTCKEALVACEKIARRLETNIDAIVTQITEHGIAKDNHGRGLNPFPQVQDLDIDCGAFLIQANRAIKLICELPTLFFDLIKTDSNFDHLSTRLAETLGETAPATTFVRDNADSVRYLIDLRNYHEHPRKIRTVIENFHVLPNGQIQAPVWYLEGNGEIDPHPIKEESAVALDFIRDVAETLFIHLVMQRISKTFPYYIEQVPDDQVSKAIPIRYRLTIDASKIHRATPTDGA